VSLSSRYLYSIYIYVCVCVCVCVDALWCFAKKKIFLIRQDILCPDGSNGQFKLLNNLFMSKYYGILNVMIFLRFLTIF
jgi:hypothetical protein